jgi:hypothetical protein
VSSLGQMLCERFTPFAFVLGLVASVLSEHQVKLTTASAVVQVVAEF